MTLLVAAFLILKAYALLPHPSDEGIYFYGALRLSEGAVPYRGFFFAHPPLHLLVPALLFELAGGFRLGLAKAVPFLAAALQGVCAYLVVRRLSRPHGRVPAEVAGVASAAVLLLSESLLKASSSATGINQAAGLLALSAALLTFSRPAAAGVAAGCAVSTLIQAAPVAAVLGGIAIAHGRRPGLRFAAGSAAVLLLFHAVFLGLAGKEFLEQVYFFHLAKVDRPGEGARQLGFILVDNWTLFSGAALGALALALAGGRDRLVAAAGLAAIAAQLVAMATRPRVFPFYFQPAFFPAAALLGCGAALVASGVRAKRGARLSRGNAAVVAGLALGAWTLLKWPLAGAVSPRRAEQVETYTQTYTWEDAPGIGALNAIVRSVFWRDGVRTPGRDYNPVTQYLWQRSRWLDTHGAMVQAVRLLAGDRPGATLFGDSTTAPLIALQAGLRITGDLVDTNVERFRSGVAKFSQIEGLLDGAPAALLLLSPRDGIGSLPEMQSYAARCCVVAARFESRIGAVHEIWKRR